MRLAVSIGLALLIAACGPRPDPAEPALWQVTGRDGGKAWLFGTIHSLERPAQWRGAAIDRALDEADLLMVEISEIDDPAAHQAEFARLATSPGHGTLSRRVEPEVRPALLDLLARNGLKDSQFAHTETWAAALTIAQAETQELSSEYGIDRAVMKVAMAIGMPVEELEGLTGQLSIFDQLPETEQRDLLGAILSEAGAPDGQSADLAAAWRKGDMKLIERETERGMLADPELRAALFIERNNRWLGLIVSAMKQGKRPLIAVGAAHMAGADGLPALLSNSGFAVRRIQ
ncbi:MAG: TraB/GumN family protein [Sphingomonadaceae bacterium]|nr:TraB/GumN family protein [Sphingomonadaceae bacterium]